MYERVHELHLVSIRTIHLVQSVGEGVIIEGRGVLMVWCG